MRHRSALVGLAVAALAVTTTMVASAAPGAKTPAPKSGTWKLTQSFESTKGGQFTVTHHHKAIKALTTKIGSAEVQYCGTGKVRVLGKHRIHLVHKAGTRAYIVGGGLDASTSYGISPVKTKVMFKGTKYDGDVRIRFDDDGTGNGQVDFSPISGLACDLVFDVHHAH